MNRQRNLVPTLRVLALASAAVLLAHGNSRAAAPSLEFLHAAQDNGYGEVALDYLDHLRARGGLSKKLADTFDLEMSRSFRVSVAEAFNSTEAEQRLAKAQEHLDKFLKEHPADSEVPRAIESWGDITLDRALEHTRHAASAPEQAEKNKHLLAARADLEEARRRFADATARDLEQYTNLNASPAAPTKKSKASAAALKKQRLAEEALKEAEGNWLTARFKLAKIDFFLGQTYSTRENDPRQAAFEAAAKAFDAIFQGYRESLIGLHAHLWHGRAADAMGNDPLALDIYDEVLATAPESRDRETGLEPLFAQVQYHRLLVVLRGKNGRQDFLAQAVPWMKQNRGWKRLDGFQGIAVEVARAELAEAAEQSGSKKSALVQSAVTMLAEIAKVPGEHQQEAILLRRKYVKSPTSDPGVAKTFDEAAALGNAAVESQDWPAAVASLTRALELRSQAKDTARLTEVEVRLDLARYRVAWLDFAAGKYEDSLSAAQSIARERPTGPLAAAASALAVSAALSLYTAADDKPAALDRLVTLANEVIQHWPDKAEADDARIALGQASLVRGELAAAIEVFEHVNPRSQRYPAALFLAGQSHWRVYLAGKAKTPDKAPLERLSGDRAKAAEQLALSLAEQLRLLQPGERISRPLLETQLLLGELKIDASQAKEAAELLDPLVDWIRAEKPSSLDNTLLRVFVAATRADMSNGDSARAVGTARLLAESAADSDSAGGAPADAVLISILRMFVDAWKQAEDSASEASTGSDPAQRSAAKMVAAQRKEQTSQLFALVAKRKQHPPVAMIYVADTSAELGQTDLAREIYQSILTLAESDPTFRQAVSPSVTRIQSQLAGLLRQKGEFAEGLRQVDKVIEAFPNSLAPKMEKGRLLQGWAEVDPAHLSEAISHWTALRARLAKAPKKPPEYYEVVYNAALCLFTEGLRTNNPQRALQAEQLLNATLVLSPQLNGPPMIARYKELLQRVRQHQGRTS